MSELKAQTLQAKMGFQDNDLKHPDHDAVMAKFLDREWLQCLLTQFFTKAQNISVEEVLLEQKLTSSNGFIIGFIDVVVQFKFGPVKVDEEEVWKQGEKSIIRREWRNMGRFYVEIKAKEKPTAGEVLRQIATYKGRSGDPKREWWALVTLGEFRGKELLTHEKIGVVELNPALDSYQIFR